MDRTPPTHPRHSATFDPYTLSEIRRAAATGIYDIRGGGAKRAGDGESPVRAPAEKITPEPSEERR